MVLEMKNFTLLRDIIDLERPKTAAMGLENLHFRGWDIYSRSLYYLSQIFYIVTIVQNRGKGL